MFHRFSLTVIHETNKSSRTLVSLASFVAQSEYCVILPRRVSEKNTHLTESLDIQRDAAMLHSLRLISYEISVDQSTKAPVVPSFQSVGILIANLTSSHNYYHHGHGEVLMKGLWIQ